MYMCVYLQIYTYKVFYSFNLHIYVYIITHAHTNPALSQNNMAKLGVGLPSQPENIDDLEVVITIYFF